ncbi:5-formyltetrahydrofolate cyclo-ligase [Flavihumibacter petaseus]|uniref:5-formyltetrahydrofolate cyclo-ligase n=1 Tax=Flavihumibacter petaseus NBRC 106054 TaxID=1220578 RepID=A0A0E9N3L7_9BACT|nr:5-formyltetrahydrofolate cyclo-ligase [Flavihumibacter petaseus]GAO44577.1 putative 5-formyltetrahydrofolate cyclo-ligase [Flavihumibacter petaseus NBRC 106054]
MTKTDLRKIYREKRLTLTDSERSKLDDLVLIRFQEWSLPGFPESILAFWSLAESHEPSSFLLTDFMQFRIPGLSLAYPKTYPEESRMEAIGVDDDTRFVKGPYGIGEPKSGPVWDPLQIDLVLVPLLTFDQHGHRLGYGKGYYDRFLERCRPDCFRLGISYFPPVDVIPGINEFDVPLNACITPETVYEF